MARSSVWTLTHITFDAETREWRLKGECSGPPIDEPALIWGRGSTFPEALAKWEAMALHHQQIRSESLGGCNCGENQGTGPSLPHKTSCPRA